MIDTHVYKLLTKPEFEAAKASGVTDVEVDRTDGFVHLSMKAQVEETAEKYFRDRGTIYLLRFAVEVLSPLKWEESRGGQLFPHLYGPLEITLADGAWRLDEGNGGVPRFPLEF